MYDLILQIFSETWWIFCCVPLFLLIFVGVLSYEYLYHRPKFISTMDRLAKTMSLQPIHLRTWSNELAQRGYTWYVGQYKKHDVAMTIMPLKRGVDGSWGFYLRLAISVNVAAPLNITLYRDRERGGIPQNFDQAFPKPLLGGGQRNVDQLSPGTREALLAFVQKESPPAGLQLPGVRLLERKRGRHVRLYDRQAVPGIILPPEILSQTPVVFMHDRPLSSRKLFMREALSPEEVRMLLDDMITVAESIANDTTLKDLHSYPNADKITHNT